MSVKKLFEQYTPEEIADGFVLPVKLPARPGARFRTKAKRGGVLVPRRKTINCPTRRSQVANYASHDVPCCRKRFSIPRPACIAFTFYPGGGLSWRHR